MSSKYKIGDGQYAHFVTFTVVNWIDVFTRDEYRTIIIDSLNYGIKHKGLLVHAYCIMTNHVHLIISANDANVNLAFIVRDIKKFTSYKLLDTIRHNRFESKKEWMLGCLNEQEVKMRATNVVNSGRMVIIPLNLAMLF